MMTEKELIELATRKLRRFVTGRPGWQAGAQRLLDAGYTQKDGTGLSPVVFEKEGEDALYLIRATVGGVEAGQYTIQQADQIVPFDMASSTLHLLPEQMPSDPSKAAYAWVPHRLADKPDIFSVRDAADHLAVSPVTIKYATSRPGVSHPLVSSLNNTTSRHLFTEKDILFWNLRRGRGKGHGGRKPTSKAMTRERLYYTAERNLRHRIALMIEQGDMPASTFRSLYLKVTGQGAPDTDDPDVLSALPAMRIHLVEILSEVGKQLEMAGNHG